MPIHLVGLDLSIGATGVVVMKYKPVSKGGDDGGYKDEFDVLSSSVCGAPDPKGGDVDKAERLFLLSESVAKSIAEWGPFDEMLLFVEGYSFGSPHAARRIAEVHGAIFSKLYSKFFVEPRYVTPASAKKVACPDYHGWSKDNWLRAGKRGKWKRSMPPKEDVIMGVAQRFKVGFATDAEADAFSVAVAGAESIKFISSRNTWFYDRRTLSVPKMYAKR